MSHSINIHKNLLLWTTDSQISTFARTCYHEQQMDTSQHPKQSHPRKEKRPPAKSWKLHLGIIHGWWPVPFVMTMDSCFAGARGTLFSKPQWVYFGHTSYCHCQKFSSLPVYLPRFIMISELENKGGRYCDATYMQMQCTMILIDNSYSPAILPWTQTMNLETCNPSKLWWRLLHLTCALWGTALSILLKQNDLTGCHPGFLIWYAI